MNICLYCSDLKPRKKTRKGTSRLPHPVTRKVQVIRNHLLIHHRILRVLQKKNLKSEKRNTRKIPRNIRRKRKRERKARRGQYWGFFFFSPNIFLCSIVFLSCNDTKYCSVTGEVGMWKFWRLILYMTLLFLIWWQSTMSICICTAACTGMKEMD